MTIFLDESAPTPLAYRLVGHMVESVASMSWHGTQNGKLLKIINAAGFEVFITSDKNMVYQQNMTHYNFARSCCPRMIGKWSGIKCRPSEMHYSL